MNDEKLVRVTRANTVLRVPQADVEYYRRLGFDVAAGKGKVNKGVPGNADALKRLYLDAQTKVNKLEEQVATLTAELEQVKKTVPKPKSTPKHKPAPEPEIKVEE